jgi:hypothetical protein
VAYPYPAGMVLLAAVIGYSDLEPAFFTALHHAAAADPSRDWLNWLRQLQELYPHTADMEASPVKGRA